MKRPVLDGELAPNVAIQFRLRILQIQDELDIADMQFKEIPILENYQNFYGWLGVLISRMSSAPVFKKYKSDENEKLTDLRMKYKNAKNSLTHKLLFQDSFESLLDIKSGLEEIISQSPIYDFEFAQEEGTVLSDD